MLCIISTCRCGTITGSVSFTPTTIRTSATYTFSIVNSRYLQASEVIQILFPTSDYDFSSQSTTTATKTCTPLTGMPTTGITSCSLNKSTNILTITLAAATTSYTISFSVDSITNPLYSKSTSSISITTLTSAGATIDTSSGSFTVTATPGALAVTLTSATYTVGATENLKFSLTLTNSISPDGKIVIVLPKWNPSSSSPVSIFAAGSPTCVAVTNISSIACAYTTNIDTSNTQDQIIVTGTIATGATTIEFSISNYRNPPSTQPVTTIIVYTTTSIITNMLDKDDSISLTMTTAATILSSSVTITPSDTVIQKSTVYTFNIRVFNPLPVGASIIITFPAEITPTSSTVSAVGTGKLNSLIVTDYNTSTKVLTLTEVITSQSNYVSSGEYIQFTVTPITNPTTTVTSSSFTIKTMESVYYSIESGSSGITVTATPGGISTFTVSPSNIKVRESTTYTFDFITENDISVGSKLTIIFPSEITVDNRSATSCVSGATSISSSSATCTVSDNKTLVISGGFTSVVTAGLDIIFTVDSITNANTVKPTSYFQAQFADSSSNIIDKYKLTTLTYTFVTNTLQALTITPTSLYTGVVTTFTFALTTATNMPILANSKLKIIIPDEITIGNTATSAASCGSSSGFSGTITCSFSSSNTLVVTGGFTSALAGASAQFSIGGIRNPRSNTKTLSFKFYVNDANDYGQYAVESGLGVTVSSISDFTAISITRDSTVNSVSTTYYFTITLSNIIVSGDYIEIIFPSEISISSVVNQCKGITNLSSSLVCSLQGNSIYIIVSLLSGVTQLPTVAGDTSTSIKFSVSSVVNPPTLSTSSTLQIYFLTSSLNNYINQRISGLTITNTQAGTFTVASAYPDSTDLGATTNYLITMQPANSIAQNTVIKVTIPSQIGISSSSSISCTSVLIIESTLTCAYDSSTRKVTVTNGFIAKSSYVSTQIEFKINNLINPNIAMTTDSFVIQTMTASNVLYNSISSGVTYTKPCNSPCKTCETDLSTCTSCYTTSDKGYLSQSKCVSSCPSGEYTDSSYICHSCQSPCATCVTSATNCLSCTSNPQLYLLSNECVSSCPDLYTVSSDGITCVKTGEIVVPFIGLSLYLIFIAILAFIKWKWRRTMFLTTLIAATSYLFIILLIIIFSLQYRDSHFQSGTITLVSFCVLIVLNIVYSLFIYFKEIRKDILFVVWKEVYPKTEIFIFICNCAINFQCIRLTFCQFANLQRCDASIKSVEMMNIKLNRFTIFQILFVLLPTFCACFYNLFWTTYQRQVFWNDIELIVILTILIVVMVLDVWMKDESALLENYVDKSEFEKHIDMTDKSLVNNTVFATKEDLLTNRGLYGENLENDEVKKTIYNKFGHIVSKDGFNNNIKDFDRLIHVEKEEEIHSNNSEKVLPNKPDNQFSAFRKRYRQNSPSKKNNSQSLSEEEFHEEIQSRNFDKDDTTNNQSSHKHEESSNGSNLDQNLEVGYRSGGNNMIQKEMMKNTLPSQKLQHFPVEIESHAVIKARGELKEEIEKEGILEEIQVNLDSEIKTLINELSELEKKKLVVTLARYSIASGDLMEKGVVKVDRETDSRGTQYLRSDLYGESHDDEIKDNVEKSLKAENNARKWLMTNHNLITASVKTKRALSSHSNENLDEKKSPKKSKKKHESNSSK